MSRDPIRTAGQAHTGRRWTLLTSLACLLMAFSLLASGCSRRTTTTDQAPDLRLDIVEFRPDPPAVGQATLLVRLSDQQGRPIEGATLSLRGDMTHAGMEPVLEDAEEVGEGLYRVTFEWTMAGDWVITVSGTIKDSRTIRREFQVNVPGGGG